MAELTRKRLLAGGVAGAAALAAAPWPRRTAADGADDIVGSWFATHHRDRSAAGLVRRAS